MMRDRDVGGIIKIPTDVMPKEHFRLVGGTRQWNSRHPYVFGNGELFPCLDAEKEDKTTTIRHPSQTMMGKYKEREKGSNNIRQRI